MRRTTSAAGTLFSSDLQPTRHPGLSQFSAISSGTLACSPPSPPHQNYPKLCHNTFLRFIPFYVSAVSYKISYRISYRIYFCLSRWNVVPSTSHLSCYSFPPTPLLPLRLSPSSNTHIVIPAGLRQQCRPISHLHQSAPLPLLWLAMGHPGGAQSASAALGSLLHLVSDATVVSS